MSERNKHKHPCSIFSLESDEEMFGTAPRVETWFLLEYGGHWTGDAFKDSKIPGKVKKRIKRYLKTYKNSRLQLIKQQKATEEGIKLFIALSTESRPRLYELTLEGYEDLLRLDIKSLLKGDSNLRKEPLFLICTNGEYDTCCGKFGMPVYLDIAEGVHGPDTWQTIHIGGHRFASTFICFPHGLYYGGIREGRRAEELIEEYKKGHINIRNYRGRTCYEQEVQAAEYFLRKETGISEIAICPLKKHKKTKRGLSVEFIYKDEKTKYKMKIRKLADQIRVFKNCGDKKTSYVTQYRLKDFKTGPAD
ncbi:MAG: sucrase ferredoxin [Deltaproteobacteria bacterium]